MIDDSDHPFIATARKYTDAAEVTGDDALDMHLMNFTCLHPTDRTQVLQQLDTLMEADDGVGLRQKAKLLNLSRSLADSHYAMRKANR